MGEEMSDEAADIVDQLIERARGGFAHDELDEAAAEEIAALRKRVEELEGALKRAEQFISNGIEMGYIAEPQRGDPAMDTLPAIRTVLGGSQ